MKYLRFKLKILWYGIRINFSLKEELKPKFLHSCFVKLSHGHCVCSDLSKTFNWFSPWGENENVTHDIWATSWQNQQNGMCVQRRLRSAWASAQSDQSLRCALSGSLRTQAFFMRKARTLIRLGGCPGWSKSSLGVHGILLGLSWGGSHSKL